MRINAKIISVLIGMLIGGVFLYGYRLADKALDTIKESSHSEYYKRNNERLWNIIQHPYSYGGLWDINLVSEHLLSSVDIAAAKVNNRYWTLEMEQAADLLSDTGIIVNGHDATYIITDKESQRISEHRLKRRAEGKN